jgi:hypothetical protein
VSEASARASTACCASMLGRLAGRPSASPARTRACLPQTRVCSVCERSATYTRAAPLLSAPRMRAVRSATYTRAAVVCASPPTRARVSCACLGGAAGGGGTLARPWVCAGAYAPFCTRVPAPFTERALSLAPVWVSAPHTHAHLNCACPHNSAFLRSRLMYRARHGRCNTAHTYVLR